jgi:hypothetical protein
MTERGRVSFDLSPAFRTDEVVYARLVFKPIFTYCAGLRIYNIHQTGYEAP